MKKLIEKIFKVKIFNEYEYGTLVKAVAKTGNMVRTYTDQDSYCNYGQSYKVSASDLSDVHLIENCIWKDVEPLITVLQERKENLK